jgi:hypothetical protein
LKENSGLLYTEWLIGDLNQPIKIVTAPNRNLSNQSNLSKEKSFEYIISSTKMVKTKMDKIEEETQVLLQSLIDLHKRLKLYEAEMQLLGAQIEKQLENGKK